ncbi:MAG: hypothetical protein QOH06_5004 [Acidobacteriota bacterium]|jgi:hypothetical protein|nr:hypothetical protein [Acidobacteriota bacterium]
MAGVQDYMKRVVGWDRTTTQVEARAELAYLGIHSAQLEGFSEQYKDKSAEYATVCARKLELMQEMQNLFRQGEAVVYFIRTGVRAHYGNDSEQLVAFGLVPTTRRARRGTPPPVEAPAEPVTVPDPAK